jgi:hypothetical protein
MPNSKLVFATSVQSSVIRPRSSAVLTLATSRFCLAPVRVFKSVLLLKLLNAAFERLIAVIVDDRCHRPNPSLAFHYSRRFRDAAQLAPRERDARGQLFERKACVGPPPIEGDTNHQSATGNRKRCRWVPISVYLKPKRGSALDLVAPSITDPSPEKIQRVYR